MTYKEFIQSIIDTRGQGGISESEYFEMHHILPFCLGGKGDLANNRFKRLSHNENCIGLYPEEHYLAHKLLAEENPNNDKLVYAGHRISLCKKQFLTAEDYAKLKRMRREIGFTDDHKRKIGEANKGVKHPELAEYNKKNKKGKKISEAARLKRFGNKNGGKKVLCVETGIVYDSLKKVAEFLHCNYGNLSHIINHKDGYCRGYHGKYN